MLEGSEVLGLGLGSCPLPGFVINRVRFWGFCERVCCVKKRLVSCGRTARATSSGRTVGLGGVRGWSGEIAAPS